MSCLKTQLLVTPVKLEPATPWSRVKRPTMHSLDLMSHQYISWKYKCRLFLMKYMLKEREKNTGVLDVCRMGITIFTIVISGGVSSDRFTCHGARYKIHFYCLAVEAGFYSDVVECLPVDPATWVRFPAGAGKYFRSTTLAPTANNPL